MLKKYFCLIYDQWLKRAVNDKSDPLVIVLDFFFGGSCSYCVLCRGIMFGVGLGLASWVGLVVAGLAVACTFGERYWLCAPKEGKPQ